MANTNTVDPEQLISLHAVAIRFGTAAGTMVQVLTRLDIRPQVEYNVGRQTVRKYRLIQIEQSKVGITRAVEDVQRQWKKKLAEQARANGENARGNTRTHALSRIEDKLDLIIKHLNIGERIERK